MKVSSFVFVAAVFVTSSTHVKSEPSQWSPLRSSVANDAIEDRPSRTDDENLERSMPFNPDERSLKMCETEDQPRGGWCGHRGSTFMERDCDGDGKLDYICTDDRGQNGIRLSSNRYCKDSWPKANLGRDCSAAFPTCKTSGYEYMASDAQCNASGKNWYKSHQTSEMECVRACHNANDSEDADFKWHDEGYFSYIKEDAQKKAGGINCICFTANSNCRIEKSGATKDWTLYKKCKGPLPDPPTEPTLPKTIGTVDDAWVQGQDRYGPSADNKLADKNYGSMETMKVQNWGADRHWIAFVKFDVSAYQGKEVGCATVDFTSKSYERAVRPQLCVVNSNDWEESSVTYNTKPSYDKNKCFQLPVSEYDWVGNQGPFDQFSYDVTDYVKGALLDAGRSELSFALVGDANQNSANGRSIEVYSKEDNGGRGPKLSLSSSCSTNPKGVTYHLSTDYFTWDEAEAYCVARGGHLASIHSEDERTQVDEAAAGARCNGNCGPGHPAACPWYWLGAYKVGRGWAWSDGSPFDYQPSFFEYNVGGSQSKLSGWIPPARQSQCGNKGDGWHDMDPAWKQQALCKEPPQAPTPIADYGSCDDSSYEFSQADALCDATAEDWYTAASQESAGQCFQTCQNASNENKMEWHVDGWFSYSTEETVKTIGTEDDAWVQGQDRYGPSADNKLADKNYGSMETMKVQNWGADRHWIAFLKFDVSANQGKEVGCATVDFTSKSYERAVRPQLCVVNSNDWEESSVTYNTKPSYDKNKCFQLPVSVYDWVGNQGPFDQFSYDVTDYVKGALLDAGTSELSFALVGDANQNSANGRSIEVYSKEDNGGRGPKLSLASACSTNPKGVTVPVVATDTEYHLSTDYFTWDEAEAYCVARGGHLASIHSEAERTQVDEAATGARCNGNCGGLVAGCPWYWLGAYKTKSHNNQNDWAWSDGSPFDYKPSFFEVGGGGHQSKLSGWLPVSPSVSQCYGKSNGWHDMAPEWKQQALCKEPSQASPATNCMCFVAKSDCRIKANKDTKGWLMYKKCSTPQPTPLPTPSPTVAPTVSPTPGPTTDTPSVSPTVSPTVMSGHPSSSPTTSPPTPLPTPLPTPSPTQTPTPLPTPLPTPSPTQTPTPQPTPSPTRPSGWCTDSSQCQQIVCKALHCPYFICEDNRCVAGPSRTCPVEKPADGDRCAWEGQNCYYGDVTCCKKTYNSYTAECHGGIVRAYYNDICDNPICDPSSFGDPHFRTWGGHQYDFHGGCDLVLVKHPHFEAGLGLNIHIRTQIRTWWSYIEAASLQIGNDILEVQGGANSQYWLNGEKLLFPNTISKGYAQLGNFPVKMKAGNMRKHEHHAYIDLSRGESISIHAYGDFVRVSIKHKTGHKIMKSRFWGTLGLLGNFPNGNMTLRDGVTLQEDPNTFGQHWMVRPDRDPVLFHDAFDTPDAPSHCPMPEEDTRSINRLLSEGKITMEDAEKACATAPTEDFDDCVRDVIATQNTDAAGSYGGGADWDDSEDEEEEEETTKEETKVSGVEDSDDDVGLDVTAI